MSKKKIITIEEKLDEQIKSIDLIQKNIDNHIKELNKSFKQLSKSKKLKNENKEIQCIHIHVKNIEQNIFIIYNHFSNLLEILDKNGSGIEILEKEAKVDHSLGIITGYELFKLKQYSTILNDENNTNKRIKYSLKRLEDGFKSKGYKIEDYTNEEFAIEKNLKVANRIDAEDLEEGKRIISRMIKPTIFFNDVVIKSGEVELKIGVKKEK